MERNAQWRNAQQYNTQPHFYTLMVTQVAPTKRLKQAGALCYPKQDFDCCTRPVPAWD